MRQRFIRAADQRFLQCTAPSLDLPLAGDRVRDPIEDLCEDERRWPSSGGVAVDRVVVVLPGTGLRVLFGEAGVVAAVGAAQDVDRNLYPLPSS